LFICLTPLVGRPNKGILEKDAALLIAGKLNANYATLTNIQDGN
jgi:hypothetical protein